MAPLVRRVLELLPSEPAGLEELLREQIPVAMRSRLEPSGLAASGQVPARPGESALIVLSGPGIGTARIGVVLHADGGAYTVALRSEGSALPAELAGQAGLDAQPPALGERDDAGREWVGSALATLSRPAAELLDDHRWWGDLGALIMLADLLVEYPEGG